VRLVSTTDQLNRQGDALLDLAEVLAAAERLDRAAGAIREAAELYERKGNVVSAARTRSLLATADTR
jgi:hypothetical protein